ncbi:MAG: DUF1598 domain-containing protein [Planctomycetota bacterium]
MNAGWTSPRNSRGSVGIASLKRRPFGWTAVAFLTLIWVSSISSVSAQFIQSPLIGGPFGVGIPNNGGGIGAGAAGLNGAGQGGAAIPGAGAQGAGAMADFDSLMTLIQSTVDPETWQDLGGTSTMAPYPAGIAVDAGGMLTSLDFSDDRGPASHAEDRLRVDLARLLADSDQAAGAEEPEGTDWRRAAKLRVVSLRQLVRALAGDFESQREAFLSMAGISRVTHLAITPDDVRLAGPVGGLVAHEGWVLDSATGLPPIRPSSLAVGIDGARTGQPFGCTIDPDPARLAAAAQVGQRISDGRQALGRADEAIADALGPQNITVFGTSGGHEAAWVMIEADVHMKRLALGLEPMPEGIHSYMDLLRSHASGEASADLLLRLWFASKALDMQADITDEAALFQIQGDGLELSAENRLTTQAGARGAVVVDPLTTEYIQHFNDHWVDIRTRYPIYGSLQSIYQGAMIGELWGRYGQGSDHEVIRAALMHFASAVSPGLVTPDQVPSVALGARVRRGRKWPHFFIASGGVRVTGERLVSKDPRPYAFGAQASVMARPAPQTRWWWDLAD